jgi:D-alanyl-D-alanine dipeptidase
MDPDQIAALINQTPQRQVSAQGGNMLEDYEIAKQMYGGNEMRAMGAVTQQGTGFQESKQRYVEEQKKLQDPNYRAQQFYMSAGNMGAALQIGKSKGSALFKMGTEIDMGRAGTFMMAPDGNMDISSPDGRSVRIPAYMMAAQQGVNVLPFTGGDENADLYRTSIQNSQRVFGLLDALEDLYNDSGYIGSLSPTARAAKATQIESMLTPVVLQTLSGTKSLAGVSEKELEMIQAGIPRAASNMMWGRRSNELLKLQKLRSEIQGVVYRASKLNGIELIPKKRQPSGAGGAASSATIPGVIPE